MKKSTLYQGILQVITGILCFVIAIVYEFPFEGFLWGLTGALTVPGAILMHHYYYWTKPENKEKYVEKQKNIRIELEDERKVMLRDKSGSMTNRIMMWVLCGGVAISSILNTCGYFDPYSRYVVLGLCGLLIFQFICNNVVFGMYSKRL